MNNSSSLCCKVLIDEISSTDTAGDLGGQFLLDKFNKINKLDISFNQKWSMSVVTTKILPEFQTKLNPGIGAVGIQPSVAASTILFE